MKEIFDYLKEARTFYIATVEGDQPRVRPFGAVGEYEGKLYIVTNNTKAVFKQMIANPKVEISAMKADGSWIRLAGEVVNDERREAKAAMLEQNPSLTRMYSLDDGIFAALYFKNGTATVSSFTKPPVTYEI